MLTSLISLVSVVVPALVLLVLAQYVVMAVSQFMAEPQASRLRVMTRVSAWVVGAAFVLTYAVMLVIMMTSTQPQHDASLSVPPSYLLVPIIVLRAVLLGLTWCFAMIAAGMNVVMAGNFIKVASGRRPAAALVCSALGGVVLALAQTVALEGTTVPINVMHVAGAGLYAAAWALRR
ncbi:MAG: hypothetical protein FGM24_02505 [Candidatus Kapabacteria bacterium]|nr:hypothetical protein [Candidatus Kapabacteria bacterium]